MHPLWQGTGLTRPSTDELRKEALAALWIDSDFPKILGAELYRPHPTYVAELAIEPVVVHDF